MGRRIFCAFTTIFVVLKKYLYRFFDIDKGAFLPERAPGGLGGKHHFPESFLSTRDFLLPLKKQTIQHWLVLVEVESHSLVAHFVALGNHTLLAQESWPPAPFQQTKKFLGTATQAKVTSTCKAK
jgi:hypothetical protein